MRQVLIIGATSAIAQQTARRFALDGDRIYLVARNEEKLKAVADDLKARGASWVDTIAVDLNDFSRHGAVIQRAVESLGGIQVALIAHGTLGDQKECERDYSRAEQELKTNFLSIVSLLTPIANFMERQRSGCIAVISSVAGDRGRQSNYIYGTAKGATTIFLQGLRNRLHRAGVCVLTIKPGLVATPMTMHLKQGPLFASPETIGLGIYKAILKKRDCVYLPWFWRVVMFAIRTMPESIFKRLGL